jgi:hypothetical protein
MLDGHPNHTELFDVKHDLGGMVDVEFMVQALVLGFANKYPELTKNKGNIALLKKAGELGLVPAELANYVADAYRQLRAKQHALRLAGHDKSRTSDPALMVMRKPIRKLGKPCWAKVQVFSALRLLRHSHLVHALLKGSGFSSQKGEFLRLSNSVALATCPPCAPPGNCLIVRH